MSSILRRTIHPVTKIIDSAKGIVDYIASDETIDYSREVVRADGWRFNQVQKNFPFVNSHEHQSIENLLGKVTDFHVDRRQLIERVQWAVDVPENTLAQLGWKMTEAGYLKAVSVGFMPVNFVTPGSGKAWTKQLTELGIPEKNNLRVIFVEQEQVELSACIIGMNPNAVAKAYKAGALTDADLELFSQEHAKREIAASDTAVALLEWCETQDRGQFMDKLRGMIKRI